MAPKGQSYQNYINKLKNTVKKMNAEFVDYNMDEHTLKIKVNHF